MQPLLSWWTHSAPTSTCRVPTRSDDTHGHAFAPCCHFRNPGTLVDIASAVYACDGADKMTDGALKRKYDELKRFHLPKEFIRQIIASAVKGRASSPNPGRGRGGSGVGPAQCTVGQAVAISIGDNGVVVNVVVRKVHADGTFTVVERSHTDGKTREHRSEFVDD